uniref:Reverse transcriptase domain-containing protein n=1 Tax=Heligmosomoides polygyrus TaxID=6339 RepID=A0A183G0B0_HELPZ
LRLPAVTTVDETWNKATDAIRQAAESELGITKPGRRKVDKQAWLWTDDVKAKVREKKSLYHVFLGEKTADNWRKYQEAKKAAKKAVAVAKATHYGDVNDKLEPRDGPSFAVGRPRILRSLVWSLGAVWTQIERKNTEYPTTDVTESSSIKVNGIELLRTAVFKYLGSAVASDGKLMVEVNSCVSAAWSKWRSLTGVLCDNKIPERFKSKIYRAVVRPVAMYGAECWPVTKEVETGLSVMETKMLRWTAGVTRMDRIRNDAIRQKFGVVP